MCRPRAASAGRRWRSSRRGPRSPGRRNCRAKSSSAGPTCSRSSHAIPAWLAGDEKLGGIPAVRSPAETDKFVRDQYQLYERLAERLGSGSKVEKLPTCHRGGRRATDLVTHAIRSQRDCFPPQ